MKTRTCWTCSSRNRPALRLSPSRFPGSAYSEAAVVRFRLESDINEAYALEYIPKRTAGFPWQHSIIPW